MRPLATVPRLAILAILAILALTVATPANAQMGRFDSYGSGCPGSNQQLGCVSMNMHIAIAAGNGYASIPFGTLIPKGGARVIRFIEFPGRTRAARSLAPGGTFRVPVSIYSSIGGLPGVQLRTARVTFSGTQRLLRFTMTPVLQQARGQDLFLVFDIRNTTGVVLPVGSNGTFSPTVINQGSGWRQHVPLHWQFNVNCVVNGTPELGMPDKTLGPNINRPFQLLLRGARRNSLATLALGFQRVGVDLTPHGAPDCTLLVNPLLVTAAMTDNTGTLLVRSGVPNNRNLLNLTFLTQCAVRDTSNVLGLAFSNALAGTIGNF